MAVAKSDLAAMNDGRLRHPVFGNKGHWVEQSIRPGFFDDAMDKGSEDVRRALIDAVDAALAKLHA